MIELTEFIENISEPFMGSEIITIAQCYSGLWDRLCVYKNEVDSTIVRLDSKLLISGKVDFNELLEFADLLKIKQIEGLKEDFVSIPKRYESHSVMIFNGKLKTDSHIKPVHNMQSVFEILCQSDENFKNFTDYDYWLSDIRTRERNGLCSVFCEKDTSTAAIMARGLNHSLIAQVATKPPERGKGLSSKLILSICSGEQSIGATPFVVSKDEMTDTFYENLGFIKKTDKIIINL